ncbi:MAG TPA: helix-turn-helix transcriptional regulator, partial [Sphingobacteriaceae bacterium]|nr:helix-turn-helix transcriptional regulator [Sphingobacteriaceae bacterium]
MFFADNLKFLRKRKNRSQDETSGALGVKRTTWSAYEIGNAEPGFETLLKISDYFKIPIDILLKEKLSDWPESKIRELEIKNDIDVYGKKLRVVVTTVDSDNNSNIELVPVKAKAGYTGGYADPDYISVLPTFKLPFLSKEKKYRTFPISGDSMPPVVHGSWV